MQGGLRAQGRAQDAGAGRHCQGTGAACPQLGVGLGDTVTVPELSPGTDPSRVTEGMRGFGHRTVAAPGNVQTRAGQGLEPPGTVQGVAAVPWVPPGEL